MHANTLTETRSCMQAYELLILSTIQVLSFKRVKFTNEHLYLVKGHPFVLTGKIVHAD